MNTKALILSAILSATLAAPSFADEVWAYDAKGFSHLVTTAQGIEKAKASHSQAATKAVSTALSTAQSNAQACPDALADASVNRVFSMMIFRSACKSSGGTASEVFSDAGNGLNRLVMSCVTPDVKLSIDATYPAGKE